MEKKILLPTDFSANSMYAIQYAINLYESQDCDFYFLNNFDKYSYGQSSNVLLDPEETFNKLSENQSINGLGDILLQLSMLDTNLNHRFHMISRSSPFLEAVKEIVESVKIDMIIMGAKGMTNSEEGTYGKNSLAVMKGIRKCPILVVPKNVAMNRPEEIVLVTNFDIEFNLSEIEHLAEIARISKAKIQVLSLVDYDSLNTRQKSNMELLLKYFKDIDHSFNLLPNAIKRTAFKDHIKNRHGNIISFVHRKPSFLERIGLVTNTSDKLGYLEDIPVLALNG